MYKKYSIPSQYLKQHPHLWAAGCIIFVLAFVLVFPPSALANGLYEDRSWQFETTTERAHKAAVLDLIERKKAGMYRNTYNSTYHTDYNIAGDYIDCNLSSQSSGNQGSNSQLAPVASPTIDVSSTTSSSATGNQASGSVDSAGHSASTGLISQSGSGSVSSSPNADGTNTLTNSLSNNGSNQDSSATGNTFASDVSGVTGTGGGANVALNSDQTMANSSVSSNVSQSKACDFNTVSGSIGSPINSVNSGGN